MIRKGMLVLAASLLAACGGGGDAGAAKPAEQAKGGARPAEGQIPGGEHIAAFGGSACQATVRDR